MTFPVASSGAFGSGYTCTGCGNYVPPAISHACPGRIGVIPQSTMHIVFKPQLGEHARGALERELAKLDEAVVETAETVKFKEETLQNSRDRLQNLNERAAEIKELLDA